MRLGYTYHKELLATGDALPLPSLAKPQVTGGRGVEVGRDPHEGLKALGNAYLRSSGILTPTPPQGSITNVRCARSPVGKEGPGRVSKEHGCPKRSGYGEGGNTGRYAGGGGQHGARSTTDGQADGRQGVG